MRITTIREVLEALREPVVDLPEGTVDGLRYGNPEAPAIGIATAFVASQSVLERVQALGMNLLITHEGLFYSHREKPEWEAENEIIQAKQKFIEDSGLAVFRCHDYIHRYSPDAITQGLIRELGWSDYVEYIDESAGILSIPDMKVEEIAQMVKAKLNLPQLRLIGERSRVCRRIGVMVGYRGGGDTVIPRFEKEHLDLVIYGEGPEWETPEYVRDAVHLQEARALLVLGHGESEAPGMKYLAEWLQDKFPHLPVQYIPEQPVFQIM